MKAHVTVFLVAVAAAAGFGSSAGAQDTAVAVAPRTPRAPLAAVEDLEPAVDVGNGVPRSAPAAAPATAPARAAAAAAPPARTPQVMDTLDLGTTSITGSQELPKVLYIVPWKKSDLGDIVGRPVNTLLDEVLAPVDPEVFERHLQYYDALHRAGEEE
jgi:hypothetical protein